MPGRCEFPNCKSNAVDTKYCIGHAKMMGATKPAAGPKPIPQKSEKRKKEDKEYAAINKKKLAGDAPCKVRSPVCTGKAQGQHHKQKRSPGNLTDEKNLIDCCNPCNGYIEQHPKWAKANGFTISKFSTKPKKK